MHGIEIIAKIGISRIVIIGDSRQAIQRCRPDMKRATPNVNEFSEGYPKSLKKNSLYHILRENNVQVDFLANKGARLEVDVVTYANGELKHHIIP